MSDRSSIGLDLSCPRKEKKKQNSRIRDPNSPRHRRGDPFGGFSRRMNWISAGGSHARAEASGPWGLFGGCRYRPDTIGAGGHATDPSIKRREALLPSGQAVPTPVGGDHCAVLARMEYRTEPNQSTAACLPVIVPGYGSESRGSRMITEPHRPATVRSM